MSVPFLDKLLKPIDSLIGLGAEYIVDKDKLIEFQFKALELKQQSAMAILNTKTTPKVDAFVKLLYAMQTMWRPMVGAAMTVFGAYAHYKQLDMDVALHAMFDGAFPAWGVSRHVEKTKKKANSIAYDPNTDEWYE